MASAAVLLPGRELKADRVEGSWISKTLILLILKLLMPACHHPLCPLMMATRKLLVRAALVRSCTFALVKIGRIRTDLLGSQSKVS